MDRGTVARPGRRGFSLIEVAVALGLLAGVLLSVAGMFTYGTRQAQRAARRTVALAAARSILETFETRGFRGTWEADDPRCAAQARCRIAFPGRLDARLPAGRAEAEIVAVGAVRLDAATCLRIRVVVTWMDGGASRSVALVTVRA